MGTGVLYALAAGLMWGLVFVGPLLLPEYPAALQSVGRYLAFGLIALPLAWADRRGLARLGRDAQPFGQEQPLGAAMAFLAQQPHPLDERVRQALDSGAAGVLLAGRGHRINPRRSCP